METTKSQILWSSDDLEGSGSSSGHVKSYTCAFCKRGFSNAQALGGHMNIHRKERARLIRRFSEKNLLSLDINAKPNNSTETSESKEEMMKLQLGENSSSSHIIDQCLDLELRLGPEPREASAKITKDHFSH